MNFNANHLRKYDTVLEVFNHSGDYCVRETRVIAHKNVVERHFRATYSGIVRVFR